MGHGLPLITILKNAERSTDIVWTLVPETEEPLNYKARNLAFGHGTAYANRTGETVDFYRNGQFIKTIQPVGKTTFDD